MTGRRLAGCRREDSGDEDGRFAMQKKSTAADWVQNVIIENAAQSWSSGM